MEDTDVPYYHTCPDCGANLDPGERCDCWDQLWSLTVQMPDGDIITTRFRGPESIIRAKYAAQGGTIIRMEDLTYVRNHDQRQLPRTGTAHIVS